MFPSTGGLVKVKVDEIFWGLVCLQIQLEWALVRHHLVDVVVVGDGDGVDGGEVVEEGGSGG